MTELALAEVGMGLESLQQTQTPTSFILRTRSQLPIGTAIIFLLMMLLVGSPILALGLAVLLNFQGLFSNLLGSCLVVGGLFPAFSTSYMLLDSFLTAESCTFDKATGQFIFKERLGIFKTRTVRYPLSEIVDVEILEDIQINPNDEVYPVYQLVLRLRSGNRVPLTSLSCYYEEIPLQISTSLRKFLQLQGTSVLQKHK